MTPPTDRPDRLSDGVEPSPDELHNPDVAHEHSDINVRAIILFLAGLTVVGLVAAGAMWGVFVILDNQAAKNDPALSPLATPAGQLPPEPRLITNEPAALGKQREQERKLLEGGGWVNQGAGVGRIPIDEAKKLMLRKGLPVRAGDPVDPRLGTRAASMSDASSGRNAVVKQPAIPPQAETPKTQAPAAEKKPGGGH
jgi:hypothetical protein